MSDFTDTKFPDVAAALFEAIEAQSAENLAPIHDKLAELESELKELTDNSSSDLDDKIEKSVEQVLRDANDEIVDEVVRSDEFKSAVQRQIDEVKDHIDEEIKRAVTAALGELDVPAMIRAVLEERQFIAVFARKIALTTALAIDFMPE